MSAILAISIHAGALGDTISDHSGWVVPDVQTIAGSGKLGAENGLAALSSFMQPSGIAVGADGVIYVSDANSQLIREIREGRVSTFAGISERTASDQVRHGGYADGPAAIARFSRPMGLAIDKTGAIYVADSANHRIRKIWKGRVSTIAGTGASGSADGPGDQATFADPLSVSVDDDGNIYVADYMTGLRKISVSGVVSTLDFSKANPKVFGVSAKGSGKDLRIAWTTNTDTYMYHDGQIGRADAFAVREPTTEGLFIGRGDAIIIAGDDCVFVTDVITNSVRFLRFGSAKLDTAFMTRALVGGIREGSAVMGGFRDGPSSEALADVPLGLARNSAGDIIFTDAGNHRIRRISAFNTRGPVLDDYSNLLGRAGDYNVVVVGNSITFNNVLWGESISGILEAGLQRDAKTIGLDRRVHVSAARIDASSISVQRQFIKNYLGDGEADLVILLINPFSQNTELENRPELRNADVWKTTIPQELRSLSAELSSKHTRFILAVFPEGQFISPNEVDGRFLTDSGLMTSEDEIKARQDAMRSLEEVYSNAGTPSIPLVSKMISAEAAPDPKPFFNTNDIHLTVDGSIWVGREILSGVENLKPWLK